MAKKPKINPEEVVEIPSEEIPSEEVVVETVEIAVEETKPKIKRIVRKKPTKEEPTKGVEFISTGHTMINLACSGTAKGGIPRGRITNIVGDGSAGKTWLSLEVCNRFFHDVAKENSPIYGQKDKVKVVYNNAERVMDFHLDGVFSDDFISSIDWRYENIVEVAGMELFELIKEAQENQDTAYIYVIDSWDAMKSIKDKDRIEDDVKEVKKNHDADNKQKAGGGFKLGKAAFATQDFFPELCDRMDGIDITILIVSQVRIKIGDMFTQAYRTGGKALDFYTHLVMWLATKKKLDAQYMKETRVYGIEGEAEIKRSKVSKPFRKAGFSILYDFGLNDMVDTIRWVCNVSGKKVSISTFEELFGIEATGSGARSYEDFADFVENNNLEDQVRAKAEEIWKLIEENTQTSRKRKKE